MVDATFVQKIADITQAQQFDVSGKTFSTKPVHEVEPKPKDLPSLVAVVTLMGFGDLIRNKVEGLTPEDWLIHVQNETTVALVSLKSDEHGRRTAVIKAVPVPTQGFTFGKFMPQEEFIINVASKFASTDDLSYVIDVASGLTTGAARTSEDDGLSQKVTTKRGMSLAKELVVRNRVKLAPFRTFPEVGQPISEFLFRMRGGDDDHTPELALFEADGGKWKLDAINEVRRYLTTLDLQIPIIA